MGVSHFLEHMAFKGSGELTGEAIDKAFDDLGLDHNAWTSAEATAFWIHARPDRLLEGFPILATLLRPELRGQDLEDERKVILEEIAMYEDEPFWVLIEGLWSGITQKMDSGIVFWEPIPRLVVLPVNQCRRITPNDTDPTT